MTLKQFKKATNEQIKEYGKSIPMGRTYDEKGKLSTYRDDEGYWSKATYDENGNELSYINSLGGWYEYTYDKYGNQLTYKEKKELSFKERREEFMEEEVVINTSLITYNTNLEEINGKIDKAKDVQEILTDIQTLKRIEREMNVAEIEFDEKVKEAKKSFIEKKNALLKTIDNVKELALKQANESITYKETFKNTVDEETGEVFVKKKVTRTDSLPKGIVYNKPRTTWEYDESRITDNKFYKKTLKKKEVSKAISEGELPADIAKATLGSPSISIDGLEIEKGLMSDE